MNRNFENECIDRVKAIAEQLNALADGIDLDEIKDRIDELEDKIDPDDYTENPDYNPEDDDSEAYTLTEDAAAELEELRQKLEAYEDGDEPADLIDYFADVLDIEYRISGSGEYRSVAITVATGGPHIEVDTGSESVKLWWGSTRAEWSIHRDTSNAIDDIFTEYYDSLR